MIAVIADDLTGAAEIAGIALGYGLTVSMHMGPGEDPPQTDLIIVSTDARSKFMDEAIRITEESLRWLQSLHPRFIFKKTDSILRGHVTEELRSQMNITGINSVLLIPANPSLGRTIRNGVYFVQGVPLAESAFARDPEFPAKTSIVTELLKTPDVVSVGLEDAWPSASILIGDVTVIDDLRSWAKRWTDDYIPAGGGDFFASILSSFRDPVDLSHIVASTPLIFIKGTAFGDDDHAIRNASILDGSAMLIHSAMIGQCDALNASWVQQAADILLERGRLFIGFDHHSFMGHGDPVRMRSCMASLVDAVCTLSRPAELFIEGGSSAQAILDRMGIRDCRPSGVWSRGVVRLETLRLSVTVKPGSYPLPPSVKDMFT